MQTGCFKRYAYICMCHNYIGRMRKRVSKKIKKKEWDSDCIAIAFNYLQI